MEQIIDYQSLETKKWIYIDGEKTDYEISDMGNVYSHKRKNVVKLKPNIHADGYYLVYLRHNNKRHFKLISVLVATYFILNPDNKPQVNHKDGIKSNNKWVNLEWATQSENIQHAYDTGLMKKVSTESAQSKLSRTQVVKIKKLLRTDMKQRDIADGLGVSEAVISNIKHGRSYSDVAIDIPEGTWIDINTLK